MGGFCRLLFAKEYDASSSRTQGLSFQVRNIVTSKDNGIRVRDKDDAFSLFMGNVPKDAQGGFLRSAVQIAGGFVCENQIGAVGAGDAHLLLLPAGKLPNLPFGGFPVDPHLFQKRVGGLPFVFCPDLGDAYEKRDDRLPRR